MTDPNAPPVVMSTGTAPPDPPPARHGARLDRVLLDAAELAGWPRADVRVEVSGGVVRVYTVHASASAEPIRHVPIVSAYRSVQVWRGKYANKAAVPVTIEGAVAAGLARLAAQRRAEADDRVSAARKALAEAEEAARAATEREKRLAAVVLEDLAAVGETGTLALQPEVTP